MERLRHSRNLEEKKEQVIFDPRIEKLTPELEQQTAAATLVAVEDLRSSVPPGSAGRAANHRKRKKGWNRWRRFNPASADSGSVLDAARDYISERKALPRRRKPEGAMILRAGLDNAEYRTYIRTRR